MCYETTDHRESKRKKEGRVRGEGGREERVRGEGGRGSRRARARESARGRGIVLRS